METNPRLTADWNAAPAAGNSMVMPTKTDVCAALGPGPGVNPTPDIATIPVANLETALFTIKDGLTMTRTGGDTITVNGGTNNYYPVLDWNTTAAQDPFFANPVMGTTLDRKHERMHAEVLAANDPN